MKTWSQPYKLHLKVVDGLTVYEDDAFYTDPSHARLRAQDLVEGFVDADLVEVRITRQKRFEDRKYRRPDFSVSEELLSVWRDGHITRTGLPKSRDDAPFPPEAQRPTS